MPERTRPAPRERFSPTEDLLNLDEVIAQLEGEPSPPHQGHRQVALYHEGPFTVALFLFDEGSKLPQHVVDGPVVVHLLKGRVTINTQQNEYTLQPGQMLRLARGVEHDVNAHETSQLLVTVFLEGRGSHVDE